MDEIMKTMPEDWQNRWCEGGNCYCMGCANGSGKLTKLGFTKEQWLEWKEKNGATQG